VTRGEAARHRASVRAGETVRNSPTVSLATHIPIRGIAPSDHDGLRPGPEIPRHAGYSLR